MKTSENICGESKIFKNSTLSSKFGGPISGEIEVPGDKSISHRALILGSLAVGNTKIYGLLEGDDVIATAKALSELGVEIKKHKNEYWTISGVGIGGFEEPRQILDLGNAGTAARLLMGAISGNPITAFLTGDDSLCSRPMGRVTEPLKLMGAQIFSGSKDKLPIGIRGPDMPIPIEYDLKIPSAQVKSALLLCGLSAPGEVIINESIQSRDHTERMLKKFGSNIVTETNHKTGISTCRLIGQNELCPTNICVPGDFSSASFLIAAALMVPDSNLTIKNVGINKLRIGLLDTLVEMGAKISLSRTKNDEFEPTADISVSYSELSGINVPPERSPMMIDEYPILAVIASAAKGITQMRGIRELRLKESDRISATVNLLRASDIVVDEYEDGLAVHGNNKLLKGGSLIPTLLDHRIGMAAIILGLSSKSGISIDDSAPISTSFPGFVDIMKKIGADIFSRQ
ncbi:MAG: 3-phosphoshikimate 1-carboxyvinyltransferase [Rhodospirillaceae bacterium]|nr:3-phosphoshikimate 1-carboxyvinyltransferase [Rhodospirillaceae bacterium]|tara:strand:- start:9770 stop:11146 length:1377 start_codon:yes stop_codon:yes gene_type:complete